MVKPTIHVSGLGPKTIMHYSLDFDVIKNNDGWTATYKGKQCNCYKMWQRRNYIVMYASLTWIVWAVYKLIGYFL